MSEKISKDNSRDEMHRDEHLTERDFNLTLSNFDRTKIPQGWEYSLEPFRVRDRSLRHNIERAMRLGWRPVERKDHPEWGLPDELEALVREGEVQHQSTYIIDRDRMLMRMPKNRYQQLLNLYDNNAREQKARVAEGQGFGNDPQGIYLKDKARLESSYVSGHALNVKASYRPGSVQNSFGQ